MGLKKHRKCHGEKGATESDYIAVLYKQRCGFSKSSTFIFTLASVLEYYMSCVNNGWGCAGRFICNCKMDKILCIMSMFLNIKMFLL